MNAEEICSRMESLALDPKEYRINAGAAMVLHGLRERTHDIDIWCTPHMADALAAKYEVEMQTDGIRRFVPEPDIEIYENMQPGDTQFIRGLPVASLHDILSLKKKLNREKDQRDIALLKDAIASQRAALEPISIEPIQTEDIKACTDIYNYYIENTCITLEEDLLTPEAFGARVASISQNYPYIVARSAAGKVLGYAYLDVFNARSAYRCTADLSIYVDHIHMHDGIGARLFTEVEKLGRAQGIENIISIITSENQNSLNFHHRSGFTDIGVMRNVAFKFGRYLDVSFMQKSLK